MKKSLFISFFLIFLFLTNVNSIEWKTSDWQTKINETIRDEFKSSKKMILPLDDGDWKLVNKEFDDIYATIKSEDLLFMKFEGQTPVAFFNIIRVDNLSKWVAYMSNYIQAAVFKSEEDGCRDRQHYNYLKFYKKGFAHNCMVYFSHNIHNISCRTAHGFTIKIEYEANINNMKVFLCFLVYLLRVHLSCSYYK